MQQEVVTVVVPVYNVERYLCKCVDSILSQTYENLQVILVDDGSNDASPVLCDEYAKKDGRVSVIHQVNGGVMAARSAGVKASSGDFITFVDSDDELCGDAIESMVCCMDECTDIVLFETSADCIYTRDEYAQALLHYQHWALWGKLFRRHLLNEETLRVPKYFKVGEDFLTNLNTLRLIKGKVVCRAIHKYLYNTSNPNSVQAVHRHDYEYEKRMVEAAVAIMDKTACGPEVAQTFFEWRMDYLGGVIGYRYEVKYEDDWIQALIGEAPQRQISRKNRLILSAAKGNKTSRGIIVGLRIIKNWAGKLKRVIKR